MSLRYLLIALPPLVILVAMGIERIAALVSLLTARFSQRLGRSLSLFTIVLLCLGNLATSWFFITKHEYPRPPWREFAQRLSSVATDESVVVVGDLGDFLVLKHYFEIYAIPAQISVCDYKSQPIREALENNQDVWVALPMRNISPEINRELTGMYREFPEFPLLDVRRSRLHFISVERKRELLQHAVSLENPLVPVVMGENDDLFLGIGFDRLERWDQTSVRALDGSRAEFFLPLDRPFPLSISLSFVPYRPYDQPPLSITLKVNGNLIAEKKVINGWNCLTWEIDPQRLHKGINRIEIIPNRTLQQVQEDNNSKDSRILSIWIEKILAEIREGG
jgi:hypothetical protein